MDSLDRSLLNYLFTERPPVAHHATMARELICEDPSCNKLIDYICRTVQPDKAIPDYTTMYTLCDDPELREAIKESVGVDKIAGDLDGYSVLFNKRKVDAKVERLSNEMRKALEAQDKEKVMKLAGEISILSGSYRNVVRPVEDDAFMDIDSIIKPEVLLSTHIPRLNQHLGGFPNGLDFEETGGFSLGELVVIGGSTNQGKSTLAASFWYHFIAKSKDDPTFKSVYFNYEGAYDRFRKTLFSMVTGVYPYKNDPSYYRAAIEEYRRFIAPRKGNFTLYDGAGGDMPVNTGSLEVEISKRAEEGNRIFIIDTINSIDSKDDSKESHQITEKAMRMLEKVAKRYELVIIATAQNKQGLQFEEEQWPELRWIGQSATLQQKCGVALGIYRADRFSGGTIDYTTVAMMKARHRAVAPKEGINVSYDTRRRMYIPYNGKGTDVINASPQTQTRQIFSALKGEVETAYAKT